MKNAFNKVTPNNLITIFTALQEDVFDHQGKFVRKDTGEYYFDLFRAHEDIARKAGIQGRPPNAGKLTASLPPPKNSLYS